MYNRDQKQLIARLVIAPTQQLISRPLVKGESHSVSLSLSRDLAKSQCVEESTFFRVIFNQRGIRLY